jgi:outer membrane protein OmpA-like peptidoglycan-associated protein
MSREASFLTRSKDENWQPVLELAVEEVFGIMLNHKVKPVATSEHQAKADFTAMVGLAGALCGVLTVCCDAKTAPQIAKSMLGDSANSDEEVADALGEVCNMIAGNFETGSAQMKAASQAAFDQIAAMLHQHDYRLRIEGHTDNVPIHTAQFPSNWELSTSRATEIVRLLVVREGFAPDRLSAAGYAEYHPVATNFTSEGRGMNRRVDIVVLGHQTLESPPPKSRTQTPAKAPDALPAGTEPAKVPVKPSPSVTFKPVAKTAGEHLQQ